MTANLRFRFLVDGILRNWSGRVPSPLAPHSRLMVLRQSDLILRSSCLGEVRWTQEGHLPAHVGLLVWTISRCRSCSCCLYVVRCLKSSLIRALFVSVAWNSHRTAGHTVNASSTKSITHTTKQQQFLVVEGWGWRSRQEFHSQVNRTL